MAKKLKKKERTLITVYPSPDALRCFGGKAPSLNLALTAAADLSGQIVQRGYLVGKRWIFKQVYDWSDQNCEYYVARTQCGDCQNDICNGGPVNRSWRKISIGELRDLLADEGYEFK